MNILDEIVVHKRREVEQAKVRITQSELQKSQYFARRPFSIREFLVRRDESGIIAEIKRKSPSKGIINHNVSVSRISTGYVHAGVSALSILTDTNFFGGSNQDLSEARELHACPILRKDFTIDEYQIFEAKSIGADVILLIAAILTPWEVAHFTKLAHSLGLEVLLEVHNEQELRDNAAAKVDLMGVNNRNLKTFEINIETSKALAPLMPAGALAVSESGIESPKAILELRKLGFRGFLIGQTFMQSDDPGKAAHDFIADLKTMESGAHAQ